MFELNMKECPMYQEARWAAKQAVDDVATSRGELGDTVENTTSPRPVGRINRVITSISNIFTGGYFALSSYAMSCAGG
jgi:hypothetical protein